MSHRHFPSEKRFELLMKIEESRSNGLPVHTACRKAGVTDTTYYKWRKEFSVDQAANNNFNNYLMH